MTRPSMLLMICYVQFQRVSGYQAKLNGEVDAARLNRVAANDVSLMVSLPVMSTEAPYFWASQELEKYLITSKRRG